MQLPEIGEGLALGVGKGTYRFGIVGADASVEATSPIDTPRTPDEFFAMTAQWVLEAAHEGAKWGVLGVPGPVSVEVDHDDNVTQRMQLTNIPDLNPPEGFDPITQMINANPEVEDLLESGFTFLTVNDGDLAVQAGAKLFGQGYNVVGDVINGSGTGGALARRDTRFPDHDLFHPDAGLWELGHTPFSLDFPSRTMETTISGQAIEAHLGMPVEELDDNDPIFSEIAQGIAGKVIELGILGGAKLVVISGGIGIGAQHDYEEHLLRALDRFGSSHNPFADRVPDVKIPVRAMAQTYELHGAHGAMLSHLTRRAIDQLVLAAE